MTTITVKGSKELQAALARLGDRIGEVTKEALDATGLELRTDIIERYNEGPATGAVYYFIYDPETGYTTTYANDTEGFVRAQKGNHSRPQHQASAAGEAPMTDTGRLAGSVLFKRTSETSISVFSMLDYASYLEYGTRKILPRPAWQPAADAIQPKLQRRLEAVLARETR